VRARRLHPAKRCRNSDRHSRAGHVRRMVQLGPGGALRFASCRHEFGKKRTVEVAHDDRELEALHGRLHIAELAQLMAGLRLGGFIVWPLRPTIDVWKAVIEAAFHQARIIVKQLIGTESGRSMQFQAMIFVNL
jgi:hypothetical protein